MTTKPVVLWSTPRSVSTAFDKMVRGRGDHRVFTEPFSVTYHFGPDRLSDRFARETLPRSSYADVWDDVLSAADQSPVFDAVRHVVRHDLPWSRDSGTSSPSQADQRVVREPCRRRRSERNGVPAGARGRY